MTENSRQMSLLEMGDSSIQNFESKNSGTQDVSDELKVQNAINTSSVIKANERQQQAINTLVGPVMLLAGPGTGKTFTLIERIKSMLKNGVLPSEILCLTFSEAASSEMKTRLVKAMGVMPQVL